MFNLVFAALVMTMASQELPDGYGDSHWGLTVEELTSQVDVHKAVPGSEYSYADHTELDPDVYVRVTEKNTRVEYYFYNGLLYKIYVVYDRSRSSAEFYKQLIEETRKKYGPAQSSYQEKSFGLLIFHVKWDGGNSSLDLRSGAGYIYEVYIDKNAERKKASEYRKRKLKENSV